MLRVEAIPVLEDNYVWAIIGNGRCAIVDPGVDEPILSWLRQNKLNLSAILVTHHHGDHIGGISGLLARYRVPVYGPAREAINEVSHPLNDGDRLKLTDMQAEFSVISVPGHTSGHIAYFGHGMLFCGDTLFACGCGRIFEGTPEEMYESVQKLGNLPGDTLVYCAHEYTLGNIAFARTLEPDNAALTTRVEQERDKRAQGLPTLPSTLALEHATNPFLRCHEPAIREAAERHIRHSLSNPTEIFAVVRKMKNLYRQ